MKCLQPDPKVTRIKGDTHNDFGKVWDLIIVTQKRTFQKFYYFLMFFFQAKVKNRLKEQTLNTYK